MRVLMFDFRMFRLTRYFNGMFVSVEHLSLQQCRMKEQKWYGKIPYGVSTYEPICFGHDSTLNLKTTR